MFNVITSYSIHYTKLYENHSVTVTANLPDDGAEGVLMCVGGDTSGWAFTVEDGKLRNNFV